MSSCPTVRIVAPISGDNPLGYIVINEADLADGHELYEEPKVEDPKSDDAPKGKKGA